MNKVTFAGREWNFGFRSIWGPLYAYEVVQAQLGIPDFDARKNVCRHVLFWLILREQNEDFNLTFDEFSEELNNLELVKELETIYSATMESLQAPERDENKGKKVKKK